MDKDLSNPKTIEKLRDAHQEKQTFTSEAEAQTNKELHDERIKTSKEQRQNLSVSVQPSASFINAQPSVQLETARRNTLKSISEEDY